MDLTLFCATDVPWLEKPFSHGDFSFASDWHILVRVPKKSDIDAEKPEQIRLDEIVFETPCSSVKFPEYDQPEMKECQTCRGCGFSSECEECDGEGFVEIENGYNEYECECKTCKGEGLIPGGEKRCTSCAGTGKTYVDQYPYVDIGDVRLGIRLLDKIKDLPNITLGTVDGHSRSMVSFSFDGGDGIMMTMRKCGF